MRRVVVTGLGAVTPIGNDVDTFWCNVKKEEIGFGPITAFDATEYKCKLAAQVKDFDPALYMDKKAARRMERFSQFAVAAAGEALKDADLHMEHEDAYRVGCAVGCGIGSLQAMEKEHQRLLEKGPGRVAPLLVP
jgi:3-oxoacyl-[acyl-carrier-protein] synthase II